MNIDFGISDDATRITWKVIAYYAPEPNIFILFHLKLTGTEVELEAGRLNWAQSKAWVTMNDDLLIEPIDSWSETMELLEYMRDQDKLNREVVQ